MNRTCLNLDSFPNKGFIRGIPNHHGFQSQVTLIQDERDLDGYLHDLDGYPEPRFSLSPPSPAGKAHGSVALRPGSSSPRTPPNVDNPIDWEKIWKYIPGTLNALILKIPERYPVRASSLQCFRKYNETWRCIAIYLRRMILRNCYMFFLLVAILWNQRRLRYV